MKVFFAPHNDDETLFGAFTILRESPLVVVCLRAGRGIPYGIREAETDDAMRELAAEWVQWKTDNSMSYGLIYEATASGMRLLDAREEISEVWAPWPHEPSHDQHRLVGECAHEVFNSRVTYYLTYRDERPYPRSQQGVPVPILDPSWAWRKQKALLSYRSQWNADGINHFLNDQREYYAR